MCVVLYVVTPLKTNEEYITNIMWRKWQEHLNDVYIFPLKWKVQICNRVLPCGISLCFKMMCTLFIAALQGLCCVIKYPWEKILPLLTVNFAQINRVRRCRTYWIGNIVFLLTLFIVFWVHRKFRKVSVTTKR